MSVSILGYHQILPSSFINHPVSQIENLKFSCWRNFAGPRFAYFFQIVAMKRLCVPMWLPLLSPSIHCLKNLEHLTTRDDFALYVASGVFIEKIENHTKHLIKVYEELNEQSTAQETMQKVYRGSPPLLALQTLTNAAMSFISQYSGIKGNNATFGTTSISGFYAFA
jgi:hypothetical protein